MIESIELGPAVAHFLESQVSGLDFVDIFSEFSGP